MLEQLRRNFWKPLSAIVVLVLATNPEMIHLTLFIDALGLEVLVLLVEAQVITIIGGLLFGKSGGEHVIGQLFRRFHLSAVMQIGRGSSWSLSPTLLSPAMLMHAVVGSALVLAAGGAMQ